MIQIGSGTCRVGERRTMWQDRYDDLGRNVDKTGRDNDHRAIVGTLNIED